MNLWTYLLVGAAAIQAIGLFSFLLGLFRAPAGFQDESGFHLGSQSGLPLTALEQSETDSGEDTLPPFGRAA